MKIVAYMNFMRSRSGEIAGSFELDAEWKRICEDNAAEDGSIHVDTLMDIAHDQENSDMIGFLMGAGLHTDYVFLE